MLIEIDPDRSIVVILREQKRAEEAADQRMQEWQERIKTGGCFRRMADGLEIYGEVIGDGWKENWRRCRCYSFICPEGEAGFVHVSQMDELISRERFEAIRKKLGMAYKIAMSRVKEESLALV